MPQLGAASLRIGAFPKQIMNCPFVRGVLSQACLGEPVIKGLARLTALTKPCSLQGRDSGFIGSRAEEAEARINRKYRNSLRPLEKVRENCVIFE